MKKTTKRLGLKIETLKLLQLTEVTGASIVVTCTCTTPTATCNPTQGCTIASENC
jgi:hypothetical protein